MIKKSKIGLGTAAIGRPHYINIKQYKSKDFELANFKREGIAVLDAAYKMGVRYFDTAPGYGIAEDSILAWKEQKKIEIATKWGYTYTANFDINAKNHEIKEHSLQKLEEQWQISKGLLPQLKVYQIHSASLETGVLKNKKVLEKLWQLKIDQKIEIGLTSTGTDQLAVIEKAMEIKFDGLDLFDAFQVTYNMLDHSMLQLQSLPKRIIVKEALANGRIFRNTNYPHYNELYKLLEKLTIKYNVGFDAIALRFCMDSLHPDIVLSGAATAEQVKENIKANDFELNENEINELKSFGQKTEHYWNERKQLNWN